MHFALHSHDITQLISAFIDLFGWRRMLLKAWLIMNILFCGNMKQSSQNAEKLEPKSKAFSLKVHLWFLMEIQQPRLKLPLENLKWLLLLFKRIMSSSLTPCSLKRSPHCTALLVLELCGKVGQITRAVPKLEFIQSYLTGNDREATNSPIISLYPSVVKIA